MMINVPSGPKSKQYSEVNALRKRSLYLQGWRLPQNSIFVLFKYIHNVRFALGKTKWDSSRTQTQLLFDSENRQRTYIAQNWRSRGYIAQKNCLRILSG